MVLSALFLLLTLRHSALSGSPKPRFVFVDLGANRADSLEAFLKVPNSKFQYNYPRPSWARHQDAGKSTSPHSDMIRPTLFFFATPDLTHKMFQWFQWFHRDLPL